VKAAYAPTFDVQGKPDGWIAVVRDITQEKDTEAALLARDKQLAEEAEALAKLNECSLRLWQTSSLKEGLSEMLRAVVELLGADKGNVQILDRDRSVLTIAAQQGFDQEFLDYFPTLRNSPTRAAVLKKHIGLVFVRKTDSAWNANVKDRPSGLRGVAQRLERRHSLALILKARNNVLQAKHSQHLPHSVGRR